MVTDDETLLYLLIWLLWSFSCELRVHCVYSEMPLASIIIWPRWRAVSCPYAAASTVIVSQRRGFGFWGFADVLCSCLLLLLIELQSVYSSPSDAEIHRPSDLGVRELIPESVSAQWWPHAPGWQQRQNLSAALSSFRCLISALVEV